MKHNCTEISEQRKLDLSIMCLIKDLQQGKYEDIEFHFQGAIRAFREIIKINELEESKRRSIYMKIGTSVRITDDSRYDGYEGKIASLPLHHATLSDTYIVQFDIPEERTWSDFNEEDFQVL